MPAWKLSIHPYYVRNGFHLWHKLQGKVQKFRDLFGSLQIREPTREDAETLSNLHISYYDEDFTDFLANKNRIMWLCATNAAKELNEEMLIHTSKHNNTPMARIDCTYDTKRLTNENDQ